MASSSSSSAVSLPFLFLFVMMLLVSNLPYCSMSLTYKNNCNEQCGVLAIPYPFYITQRCGAPGFGLHCFNSTLSVKLDNTQYRVLGFSTDSILIDPLFSACQRSVSSFNFRSNKYYVISRSNLIQLSGCKKSSAYAMNCNIPVTINRTECKYDPAWCAPLLNVSMWNVGDTISDFRRFGCTSFSSWALSKPSVGAWKTEYGLEIEWGLPGGCSKVNCSPNAYCVNATTVKDGVRCQCDSGYEGDGFANGVGCFKVCYSADGSTASDKDCGNKRNVLNVSVLAGGLVAAVTILASLVIAFALLRRYRGPSTEMKRRSDSSQLAGLLSFDAKACTTKLFTYKELNKATKGFAASEKLGNGACGTVYAGELPDGHLVAVKKIHYGSPQGAQQLFNEINVLSTVRHRNLVCLFGCCIEMDSPILVYEFIPNGTLSDHLERVKGEGLDWLTRITVATETATAIAYLHCAVSPPIYHRDVKSTNILLDFDYTAKVGDFGLSRLGVPELSHISTIPQGTPGYLDPEYHQNFHLSDKSDVYSFGVVLIEIITALKPVDFSRDRKEVNLAVLAMSKIKSGCLDDIIDPFLQVEKRSLLRELVQRVAELAFRCLSYEKDSRPTMMEVAEELSQIKKASMNVTIPLARGIYKLSLESINLPDVDDSVKCAPSSWTFIEKSL